MRMLDIRQLLVVPGGQEGPDQGSVRVNKFLSRCVSNRSNRSVSHHTSSYRATPRHGIWGLEGLEGLNVNRMRLSLRRASLSLSLFLLIRLKSFKSYVLSSLLARASLCKD